MRVEVLERDRESYSRYHPVSKTGADKNLCRCFGAPVRRVFPDHLIRVSKQVKQANTVTHLTTDRLEIGRSLSTTPEVLKFCGARCAHSSPSPRGRRDQPRLTATRASGVASAKKYAHATPGPDTRLRATSGLTQWLLVLGVGRHANGWHAGVRA